MRLHVTETAKGSRASPRSTHTYVGCVLQSIPTPVGFGFVYTIPAN